MRANDIANNEEVKDAAIHELEEKFNLTTDELRRVSKLLEDEMKVGLEEYNTESNVPMLASWITSHPSGQEKGEYLGLDLSGNTNLTKLL